MDKITFASIVIVFLMAVLAVVTVVLANARRVLKEAQLELAEYQLSYDLQWSAAQRAIAMWQKAHPEKQGIWPDQAKLMVWLMEKLDDPVDRDIRRTLNDDEAPCDHPEDQRRDYHDASVMCKKCGNIIEQYGKRILS